MVVAWWICYAFFSEHRHNRSKTEAGGRSNGRAWWTEYRAVLSTGRVTPERSLFRANQRRGCFGITFGWRGVRRFGTPNLRHAPALNWKCEMPRVCKRFVNASLAKGEPIDGMIASEHNESKTHERGAIYTWTKQPTGARGGPSIGLY